MHNGHVTGKTALVADDEPALAFLIGATLRQLGFNVLTAGDSDAALGVFDNCAVPIDVAIIDVTMPGAKTVLANFTERNPSARVLLASGFGRYEALDALGVADTGVYFLQKPFTIEELRRALLAMFAGRTFTA